MAKPLPRHIGTRDASPELSIEDFRKFAALIHDICGIRLEEDKRALLRNRLLGRLRALDLASYEEYYWIVTADPAGREVRRFVDSVTTHSTRFFREESQLRHFEDTVLRDFLEDREGGRSARLNVWSAACATGEEAYSLALVVIDAAPDTRGVRIFGTDISMDSLERAERGRFPASRIEGVPPRLLREHFERQTDGPDAVYEVRPEVRSLVRFLPHNLAAEDFPLPVSFDAIFCRNVLIYFDRRTQQEVVGRLAARLSPGGHLYTGLSESLLWMESGLEYVAPSVYARAGSR